MRFCNLRWALERKSDLNRESAVASRIHMVRVPWFSDAISCLSVKNEFVCEVGVGLHRQCSSARLDCRYEARKN